METALLQKMRQQNPLVVNYANFVTPGFVANGLNELGASPIMTKAFEEAGDLMAFASALVVNLGTINQRDEKLVDALATAAKGKPIVLDPVAVGATKYRRAQADHILNTYSVAFIRGNAGEIAALADIKAQAKGIDAGSTDADLVAVAQACAKKYGCTVILSGKVDIVASGDQVGKVYNQTPLLPAVVGSGDLLSSFVGAFAGISENHFEAALMACATLASAGEIASAQLEATAGGTFAQLLLDELGRLDEKTLAAQAHVEVEA